MTNDIDVLEKTIEEYKEAIRIKRLNEGLLEHLLGTTHYLLKYSEKYGVFLPKKDELIRMMAKADFLIDEIEAHQPQGNTKKSTEEGTEPLTNMFNKVRYGTIRYG